MNLIELKREVNKAISYANESDIDPKSVKVTLQLDTPHRTDLFTDECVELHYDNNAQASGCVITGWIDEV